MEKEDDSTDDQREPQQDLGRGGSQRSRAVYSQIRVVGLAVVLPFVMVAGPIAGYIGGGWIGERLGYTTGGKLLGLLLGAAASVHQTILIIRRLLHEVK